MALSFLDEDQMTPETLKWEFEEGLLTVKGYLYYLIKLGGDDGRRLRVENVKAFCKEHNISTSSYYKTISELKAEGRINTKRQREIRFSFPEDLP